MIHHDHSIALALPFVALYGVMVFSGFKVLVYPIRKTPLRDNRRLTGRGLW